jgi:hypothetical protein
MIANLKIVAGIALSLSMISCEDLQKAEDDLASETEEEQSTEITVSGTLALDSEISSDDSDGLSPGDAIEGAAVFLKGFPDDVVESDSTGAFTLQIDVGEEKALELTEGNADLEEFTILMWKKTDKRLFGTSEDILPVPGEETEIGSFSLTYTNAIHFHVSDETTDEYIASDCEITVEGFKDKIPTKKKSFGKYDSQYMPPDDYEFIFDCEGYKLKKFTFAVPPASSNGAWVTHKFTVTPEE